LREYIDNGAQLGWLIDPASKTVWVYRPEGAPVILKEPETLSGQPVLPGLVVALSRVW
jgi:Uma2 family endonuclease